jgi:hypothetical protein
MRRITVSVIERTEKCLALLMKSGDSQTDIINQSVQKNAYLDWEVREQKTKIILESPDGTQRELVWGFDVPEEEPREQG